MGGWKGKWVGGWINHDCTCRPALLSSKEEDGAFGRGQESTRLFFGQVDMGRGDESLVMSKPMEREGGWVGGWEKRDMISCYVYYYVPDVLSFFSSFHLPGVGCVGGARSSSNENSGGGGFEGLSSR